MLAFALLLFLSTMLWYLANSSLNEYLKSQIELQGHFYSGQKTTLAVANFSENSNITTLEQLALANINTYQAKNALIVDNILVTLSESQPDPSVTAVNEVIINKLIVNIDQQENLSNINQLIQNVHLTLAKEYPQSYPEISAKIYAESHPELNAEEYAKNHPHAGPIIDHTKQKKSRSKEQQKIKISTIQINHLVLNTNNLGKTTSTQKQNVTINNIGGSQGLVINQMGGEILLNILKLATH